MKVQVLVRLKSGVLDVQGKAVEHGIKGLGHGEAGSVRIGRLIEFSIDKGSEEEAREVADELCRKLLANPIMEEYEIKIHSS